VTVCHGLPIERAATVLAGAISKGADPNLTSGLAAACKASPPPRAAKALVAALRNEANAIALRALVSQLVDVCKTLPEGVEELGPAADELAAAIENQPNPYDRAALADGLVALSEKLPRPENTKSLERAATALVAAIGKETGPHQSMLASRLANVCKQLPEGDRLRHLGPAADKIVDSFAETTNGATRKHGAETLAAFAPQLPPIPAGTTLFQAVAQAPDQAAILRPAVTELANRLGQGELAEFVELLKLPLCHGDVREILLRRLETVTGQRFRTKWDVVEYVRKNHPTINLTTPPPLPQRFRDGTDRP
jgi:hypothetical protein